MKIQAPPGMRDFYPDDMRLQNWLFEKWRGVSRAFGFQEYEGPIFEFLDLYTLKSGAGIVSELFNFEDRGQRRFAIRPEMTPTLARMVAARANALPRPIKWFSIPRMCRAEKPQRGRLREFFQWNVDVLGVEDVLADAEVISVAVEFLRQIGLTPVDVAVRVNSRPIAAALLATLGIAPENADRAFQLMDRYDKLGADEFERQWNAAYGSNAPAARLQAYLTEFSLERCLTLAGESGDAGRAAREQFEQLWDRLGSFGVREYCEFDPKVVRGLSYYTGPVFEVHGRSAGLRALLGGGRYDDLTTLLDGPKVAGVGFGMGDAPILELLRELKRLPESADSLDVFVVEAEERLFGKALEIVGMLRTAGLIADFSYRRINIGKQLKQASARSARFAVIVGSELEKAGQVALKDLRSGEQRFVPIERLTHDLGAVPPAMT